MWMAVLSSTFFNNRMELVFATNNPHKLHEVQHLLGNKITLKSLNEIGCKEEIPEDYDTLEENAIQKAEFIFNRYGLSCFADDTGLEIDALNGEPGVLSARYAGETKDSEENIKKVLRKLEGIENRTARFRTVIALIIDGKIHRFEGIVEGEILKEKHGYDGFGYDPVFRPQGFTQSFAEMPLSDKNKISHRAVATNKLVSFLLNLNT